MAKGKYLVIGLGRFGMALLDTLLEGNAEVLVFDNDEEMINQVKGKIANAVILDATNEEALKKFPLEEIDAAIVTMGDDFEKNLLTTVILKEMGVKKVVSRASAAIEEKILKKVGADMIVFPEVEMGRKLANTLLRKSVKEAIPLTDGNSIVHFKAPAYLVGKTLKETELREKYSINLVAVKKNDAEEEITVIPDSDYIILEEDTLIIVGDNNNIDRFSKERL
ncbi:MAG TPA: TrkA family potassium uptake protein [Firmicutes bacterium]|nr:TrkA family potassium uptake protein [Bacillota bacterium]